MRAWRAGGAIVIGGSVAACLFPDLSVLSGDASTTSDATVDAAIDAVSDAAPPNETSVGDAHVSPCTMAHTFCDDFDQGALGATWGGVHSKPAPVLSSIAVTPPNALEAIITSSSNDQSFVWKNFPRS